MSFPHLEIGFSRPRTTGGLVQQVDHPSGIDQLGHLLLGHPLVFKEYPDHKKFNVATDCIINDFLIGIGILVNEEIGLMRGEDIVGWDCSYSSIDDVYNAIPDNPEGHDGGNGDDSPSEGGMGSPIDQHLWDEADPSGSFGNISQQIQDYLGEVFDNLIPEMKDLVYENNPEARKMHQQDRPSTGWGNEAAAETMSRTH